ncbi:MAG: DUF2339 domain-containing protein [Myxococcota bacterium]|nr:DUF2339 domain-containing protein [Myxococcota bacterium]
MGEDRSVEERLAALEEAVRDLREAVGPRAPEAPGGADSAPLAEARSSAPATQPPPDLPPDDSDRPPGESGKVVVRGLPHEMPGDPPLRSGLRLGSAEDWLSRLGIAMLLFGVAFLFKYSIDRGWLTPAVRAAIGHGVGVALLVAGHRLTRQGRTLGLVLTGGAIATFYVTIFAQFQVLEILSQPVAFAWMLGVTALSFALALRHDQPIHAWIGALGGFGTPFLLYTGSGNVPGLVTWSSIVAAATTAVAIGRRWPQLLYVAAAGAWVVLIIALDSSSAGSPESRAIALGVVVAALVLWVAPLLAQAAAPAEAAAHPVLHVLAISTPLVGSLVLDEAYDWNRDQLGLAYALGAVAFAGTAWLLRGRDATRELSPTHGLVALLLGTLAVACLLDGDVRFTTLAVEAGILHLLARRLDSTRISLSAHALSLVVGTLLLGRLFDGPSGTALLNASAVADGIAIGALALGAASSREDMVRLSYGLAAHLAALGLFQRELAELDAGAAWVSAAWAALGAALLVVGLLNDSLRLRQLAMATFAGVAFKILALDLARLDPLVRVVTSMGFGAALLALGYLFPMLWRGHGERPGPSG